MHLKYEVFVISYLGHMRKLCSISHTSYDLDRVRKMVVAKQRGTVARTFGCQRSFLLESFFHI